jgi:hypothetical protein
MVSKIKIDFIKQAQSTRQFYKGGSQDAYIFAIFLQFGENE